MRHWGTTFFVDKGEVPKTELECNKIDEPWQATIKIKHDHTGIILYLKDESDLISFVNNVKWAYEQYRKRKGYA